MKRAILAALLGAALLTGTAGAVVDPPENTYVADYAGVLTADTEEYIIDRNETLNGATGGAIEVVTVDFLDGMAIDDYAYELFNAWGIGDGEADSCCSPGSEAFEHDDGTADSESGPQGEE